jgi:membrane-bound metal-dependent hydrolase YbcI (DUF457 family)
MADFRTHMLTSSAAGVLYGVAGAQLGMPIETCIVAGGLCSVSGMLPDLDSSSGRPLREATTLAAAIVPMLMVDRFQRLNWSHEHMVLAAAALYLGIRFGVAEIFRRYTVHRGMWHSIPAAIIVGMVSFLIMSSFDINVRIYKTIAVVLGFMSHLVLDEIWSVDFRRGQFQYKSSFGTALKLWGNDNFANTMTYSKLLALAFLVYHDHGFMAKFGPKDQIVEQTAHNFLQMLIERSQELLR